MIVRAFIVRYHYYTTNFRYKNVSKSALFFAYKNVTQSVRIYIYIIYRIVLIPNYKRTYDQSDQIEKKSLSSLLRIGPITTMNK